MLLWYLSLEYLVGAGVWLALLAVSVVWLLRQRRAVTRQPPSRGRGRKLTAIHTGLSLWIFLVPITGMELYFAGFVDRSDSFNRTNISKRWIHRHIDAEKNSLGFRDAPLARRLPAGVRRIMFFGDSFTAGQGINRCADRFSERLQVELDHARPGAVQVANLGELGLEVVQITGQVNGILEAGYSVDTVVYVFMLNDIEGYDPQTIAVMQNLGRFDPEWFLFRDTYFLNWLYFRVMAMLHTELRQYFDQLQTTYRSESWNGLAAKLQELHGICQRRHVDFRMAIYPFVHNLGPNYPFREVHQKLVKFCEAEKIPVLDLEPVLSPHAPEGLVVHRWDAHPNERANALVAEAFRTQLLADYFQLAPPAAKTPPVSAPLSSP